MWVITFQLTDQIVNNVRFSSRSLACDFWHLLLQRDDLIFASRITWSDLSDVPFPEVEDE